MNQLKISTRLVILIGIMSALLIAIGSVGLFGTSQSNAALKTVYEDRTVPMQQIAEIEFLMQRNRLVIANTLLEPTPETIAKYSAEVESNIAKVGKTWDAYMATTLTPEEAKLATAFTESRSKFVKEGLLPAVASLRANDLEGAKGFALEQVPYLFQRKTFRAF